MPWGDQTSVASTVDWCGMPYWHAAEQTFAQSRGFTEAAKTGGGGSPSSEKHL